MFVHPKVCEIKHLNEEDTASGFVHACVSSWVWEFACKSVTRWCVSAKADECECEEDNKCLCSHVCM